MRIIGFDPGGQGSFGWCVAGPGDRGMLELIGSGVADGAREAVGAALAKGCKEAESCAAGIDSPLYWALTGRRRADEALRAELKRRGVKNGWGTVQDPNSLRGACLAQGIMAAWLLRKALPTIRLTEAHPKALIWIVGIASTRRPAAKVSFADLSDYITGSSAGLTEHERDAALGAVAAYAMVTGKKGWRDLFPHEGDVFAPVPEVEYWMPID